MNANLFALDGEAPYTFHMRKFLIPSVFIAIAFLASPKALALADNSLYFGFGTLSHNLMRVSNAPSGETGFVGPVYYPFLLQSYFGLGNDWHIGPEVGYTIFGNNAPDGGSKTTYLLVNVPFSQVFGQIWDWNIGPGFIFYTVTGNGGTKALNNGSTTTTTSFGLPGGRQTSRTISFNLGIGVSVESFRFGLDTITEGVLSSTRRSFSIMFTMAYNVLGGS